MNLIEKTKSDQALWVEISFHRNALNEVKKRLGRVCTFLAPVNSKNSPVSFKAIIVKGNDRKTITIETGKTQNQLTPEDYGNINKALYEYSKD